MSAHVVRRGGALVGVLALLIALVTGCGTDRAPVEAVPQLDRMLTAVDEAVAARRYGAARTRIDALVKEVTRAREDGDLEPGQADRILAAAAELLSALPATPAPRKPKPSPTPTPTPSPTAPASDPPATSGGGGGGGGGTGGKDTGTGGGKSGGDGKATNKGKGGSKGKGGAKRKG